MQIQDSKCENSTNGCIVQQSLTPAASYRLSWRPPPASRRGRAHLLFAPPYTPPAEVGEVGTYAAQIHESSSSQAGPSRSSTRALPRGWLLSRGRRALRTSDPSTATRAAHAAVVRDRAWELVALQLLSKGFLKSGRKRCGGSAAASAAASSAASATRWPSSAVRRASGSTHRASGSVGRKKA